MKKVAFIFPGQGSQFLGMMKDINEKYETVREIFKTADDTLQRYISTLCFEGPQEELDLTHNTAPCMFMADFAAYAALISHGIKPDVVAGFSLGEFVALTVAGAMKLTDAVSIVQHRADYMQDAVPVGKGAMAAVKMLSGAEVEALCDQVDGYVVPVNFNCPGEVVVSGEAEAVKSLISVCKDRGVRAVRLLVSIPSHCKMMQPAAEKLEALLKNITISDAKLPIYMNFDAEPHTDSSEIRQRIIEQIKSPVRWEQTVRNMYNDDVDTFVELGPGIVLSKLIKRIYDPEKEVTLLNVEDIESLEKTVAYLRK